MHDGGLLFYAPSLSPPIAISKMLLFDGHQSIVHLSMTTDGSLRLASTDCQGVVKLWDIWDDGNMYVTLTSPSDETAITGFTVSAILLL